MPQKLVVIVDILVFVEQFRSQYQADGTTGEILQCAPYASTYIQTLIRMVQMKRLMLLAIKHLHIERTTHSHHHFFASAMSMTTTTLTRRNVVCPVDSSDIERHVLHLFSHRQIATRVNDLG